MHSQPLKTHSSAPPWGQQGTQVVQIQIPHKEKLSRVFLHLTRKTGVRLREKRKSQRDFRTFRGMFGLHLPSLERW
jgi:hypothetical protein